ncbi:rod shape-determining protein MreD [uncultured Psychromonas sp.]|uniref:rod shape-determining protein MreD n=1 Tax=uncultured Psychromonas sp. TaxID=173974 RepID=UPI002604D25A|nr:rod shape-determining protein MreD [uncultured Psychromonas sp.]
MSLFNSYKIIYLSFLVCLVAAIFPLPIMFNAFRPDWMLLVLSYWVMALPHRVNIGHAFILGLLLDLLLGSILGMHGLLFSLLAYFTSINFQRFRNFTLVQTTLLLGVFIFLAKLGLYWIASSMQEITLHRPYFWSIFTSMIIWPWFFLFMRFIRVRYKVS